LKTSVVFPLFNTLLLPFYPALGIYTLHRRFIKGKSAASLAGQWGVISPPMRAFGRGKNPKIWLHAVSVGECVAAKPIIAALKREIPGVRIALSNTTDTGHELGQKMVASGEIELAFFFPLDLPFIVTRVLNALRSDAIGFVETELWPNLLFLARRQNIPTFLLNGRVSDNLLRTAPKLGPFWKWMSSQVFGFLMRSREDATRLRSLGVAADKIEVVGDVKLERPPVASAELRSMWRVRLGLTSEKLFIAGSTHDGEELQTLRVFASLREHQPQLRLALAPRHVERTEEVALRIESAGWKVARRSLDEKPDENTIYLLDTVGELADFYAAGDLAFVGGTLVSRGGHNLLEPVLRGVPVVFGPSIDNFRAQAALLSSAKIGVQVEDEQQLQSVADELLRQPFADFAAQVEEVLAPHRGAAGKMAKIIADKINREAQGNF
jgi:3-deoxy-D-manno-octulosonic-acid transferase